WQLMTATALVGGLLIHWLLPVAAIGLGATLWRCFAHAFETPAMSPSSLNTSRLRFILTIAWLHYIQPWARIRGRIKGYLAPSYQSAEGRGLLESAGWLRPLDTLKLIFRRLDTTYWDVHYTSVDSFLAALKSGYEVALSPVRCDDGWRQD